MKKRYSYRQLSSLWSDKSAKLKDNIPICFGSESVLLKKTMDDICLEADLAETVEEYALAICRGIKRLIDRGAKSSDIQKHHKLINKILYFGKDLLENSAKFSESFYLGVLVDLKITSKWFERSFYNFIIKALKHILKDMEFISTELKIQLSKAFAKEN